MPKLPVISASELIKFLESKGFQRIRQRGSHIKLKHADGRTAIVPNHRQLKAGTLKKGILNPLGLTVGELSRFLKR